MPIYNPAHGSTGEFAGLDCAATRVAASARTVTHAAAAKLLKLISCILSSRRMEAKRSQVRRPSFAPQPQRRKGFSIDRNLIGGRLISDENHSRIPMEGQRITAI